MSEKSAYYVDTGLGWLLFVIGTLCTAVGCGGLILRAPPYDLTLRGPWVTAASPLAGTLLVLVAALSPLPRRVPLFTKPVMGLVLVVHAFNAVIFAVVLTEFVAWFESPDVVAVSEQSRMSADNVSDVELASDFIFLHKIRVVLVLICLMVGFGILLYRCINLGVNIYDNSFILSYNLISEEERLIYLLNKEQTKGQDKGKLIIPKYYEYVTTKKADDGDINTVDSKRTSKVGGDNISQN